MVRETLGDVLGYMLGGTDGEEAAGIALVGEELETSIGVRLGERVARGDSGDGGRAGGPNGGGGEAGGEGGCRTPQSLQSVPSSQSSYSAPAPPSSQSSSFARSHESSQRDVHIGAALGTADGTGGTQLVALHTMRQS